jgi:hypothetical protein
MSWVHPISKSQRLTDILVKAAGNLACIINSNDSMSGQKIPKFFVSHVEKSMPEHMGINGVY